MMVMELDLFQHHSQWLKPDLFIPFDQYTISHKFLQYFMKTLSG